MNKKFLSAILFGALMVTSTGTFVSCKDYDDDIDNLQGQVDATKSDLAAKVSALESSISSLQSAQSSLDSKIAAATSAAEKAALEAQKAAIAAAKADLEAAVAELKNAHDADIAEVEAAIATIKGNVEALQAFQGTTEETLEALAAADEKLATAIAGLEEEVAANATAIGKLEAAIDAQIKALEEYAASHDEDAAAHEAAIEAVAADLKKLQDTVAGLKIADPEGLEEAAAAIEEAKGEIAKLSTAVQEINTKLELISSAVYTGVTHISLAEVDGMREPLNLVSVEAVTDYVFGENLPGAVTFVKGNVETFEQTFMVRVSPTNANLDASMIKIVDSKLNSLAGLVDILEVKPYTGQLAGRAISENGLWTIKVKLVDNFDKTAYRNAAYNANWQAINYAVMVNNTSDATRQVVSEYGITINGSEKLSRYDLGYSVNNTNVANIMNRWDGNGNTYTESGNDYYTTYQELAWNLSSQTAKAISHTRIYNHAPFITPNVAGLKDANYASLASLNVWTANYTANMINPANDTWVWGYDGNGNPIYNKIVSDARYDQLALRVDADKNVAIKMANPGNVRAFYVTLDAVNAVESAPSELVAWQAYNVQGLNTVVAGNETLNLTIPAFAEGDYIGFRVYAVNYDGTLVDPDGRAFYVYVGEQTTVGAELTLTMTNGANAGTDHTTIWTTPWAAYQAYATNGWGRAAEGTYTITFSASDDVSSAAGIQYYDGKQEMQEDQIWKAIASSNFHFINAKYQPVSILGTSTVSGRTLTGKLTSSVSGLNSIVNIGMKDVNPANLRDGVTYYATITLKGKNAQVIGKSTIAFTKELPGFPVNVAPATGMLQEGNVMVFPATKNEAGKYAAFDMNGAFEGLTDKIIFEETNSPKIGLKYVYNVTNPDNTVGYYASIPVDYINPAYTSLYGKKNNVEYRYDYGQISHAYDAATETWYTQNWVTKYPFTLQFGNYFYETEMTLTPFTVNYPGAKDKEVAIELSNIEIRDWYNQVVDLRNAVRADLAPQSKEAKYLDGNATINFITENSAKPENEYYKFSHFAKAQYDAAGEFARYTKPGETFYVFNSQGQQIKKYTLKLEDCDLMIVKSQKDSFTGGSVPTWIQVVYTDNFDITVKKTSTNSFTMNFVQQ